MKTLIVLLTLVLTGGIAWAADIEGYVNPGDPFVMTWTEETPKGDGYLIERSLNGAAWTPLQSVIANEYQDALVQAGDSSQYRVRPYRDVTVTDLDGTRTEKVPGPLYSDISDTVLAGTDPGTIGKCGKPSLKP